MLSSSSLEVPVALRAGFYNECTAEQPEPEVFRVRNSYVRGLREQFMDHIAADIGQTEIPALELEREIFMV